MNISEYMSFVVSTMPKRSQELRDGLIQASLGLTSESGEIAGLVEKWISQDHPLDDVALKKEMGDLLWYFIEMCVVLGYEFDEVLEANVVKLTRRYPSGKHTPKDSILRKDTS